MAENYYDTRIKTIANSQDLLTGDNPTPHFPHEGIYVGTLKNSNASIPALVDLKERSSLVFLYNDSITKRRVNRCIERLVWRFATTLPYNQCQFILYSGGILGETFSSLSMLNDVLFAEKEHKIYYAGTQNRFLNILDSVYHSIIDRNSALNSAKKDTIVELNDSLSSSEVNHKYIFLFLTDFPSGLDQSSLLKLQQLVQAGSHLGIYVIMSWDMSARHDVDRYRSSSFDPKQMLEQMEAIYPYRDKFKFGNSGHDDILNRFDFHIDDAPVGQKDAFELSSFVDKQIQTGMTNARPNVLKQDFDTLYRQPYVPVISEIEITIGEHVITHEKISLKFNSKDYIHAFILGQSGSGKSVLLNNIISSAILKYSPEDLVLYLMDFKGVEFNRYRGVKHTKAVLVDNSDPQITLEVLRELKEENKKRVKLWQKEGVNNINGYNKKYPNQRLPQVLFVADECQVMFQTPKLGGLQFEIYREICDILNTIATQGRSQGIHMLLATQQLDETDISGQILKNLTECLLLMSAPSDSERLVPDSSDMTAKQSTGVACYYHKKELAGQIKTFYANDDELKDVIQSAHLKSKNITGNGESYFCGSSVYNLTAEDIERLSSIQTKNPTAVIGKNIGLKNTPTIVELRRDFSENVLFFGANKENQTVNVVMNALIGFMKSYKAIESPCKFLVIDCLATSDSSYKNILTKLEALEMCRIVPRQDSGIVLKAIAEDIKNGCARPAILTILGAERFIEMKRNLPLCENDSKNHEFASLSFANPFNNAKMDTMTYQQALTYILDEGPMQGVHILIQVDKPGNLLFKGDYCTDATEKFRHKVILRSENKLISPLRFTQEIDVEALSDEEEHLRAYYYPEGENPFLFTPYVLPDINLIINN